MEKKKKRKAGTQKRREERAEKLKKEKKAQYIKEWNGGIIHLFETFLLRRFPIGPMYARAISTAIVSACLGGLRLVDKQGEVRANLFFNYIAPSGLYKTPPFKFVRYLFRKYLKKLLGLSKFTKEYFTKWMEDKHPRYCIIIRDEISKLAIEKGQKHFTGLWEYLSELWDGYIEPYGTITRGYEGNIDVYVALLSSGTERFLQLVDEDFWIQGLGNRFLWIIEEPTEPTRLDPSSFFITGEKGDTESEILFKEIHKKTKTIEKLRHVTLRTKAADMWCDYEIKVRKRIFEEYNRLGITFDSRYEAKQPLNVLKLAMCYAASRSKTGSAMKKTLAIAEEDMERAIEDTKIYVDMWFKAFEMWKKVPKLSREKRLDTSLQDLETIVQGSTKAYHRLVTGEIGQEILGTTNRTKVIEILDLGVTKKILRKLNTVSNKDGLTKKQIKYIRKRSSRGQFPAVYQVIKKKKRKALI